MLCGTCRVSRQSALNLAGVLQVPARSCPESAEPYCESRDDRRRIVHAAAPHRAVCWRPARRDGRGARISAGLGQGGCPVRDSRRKGDRGLNRRLLTLAASVMLIATACSGSTSTTAPSAAATTAPSAAASTAPSEAATTAPTAAAPVTLTFWHNYGTEANASVTDALIKALRWPPTPTSRSSREPAGRQLLSPAERGRHRASRAPTSRRMWTGLFALQNQTYLEPLNHLHPGRTAQEVQRHRLVLQGLQLSQGRDLRAARHAALQRLLQQGPVRAGRDHLVPDHLGRASSPRCDKLKASGIIAVRVRHRGPGAQRRLLPLLRPQLHDDVPAGQRLAEALQRPDPVDRPRDRQPASAVGASSSPTGYTNTDVAHNDGLGGACSRPARPPWRWRAAGTSRSSPTSWATRWASSSRRSPTRPGQGRRRVPGRRLRRHQLLAAQGRRGRVPRLDGHTRGPEDHRGRRPDPGRAGTPATDPLANAMLDYAANQGYTRYPMIDNVIQPEVQDVATKVLNSVFDGTETAAKALEAMSAALDALPADREAPPTRSDRRRLSRGRLIRRPAADPPSPPATHDPDDHDDRPRGLASRRPPRVADPVEAGSARSQYLAGIVVRPAGDHPRAAAARRSRSARPPTTASPVGTASSQPGSASGTTSGCSPTPTSGGSC